MQRVPRWARGLLAVIVLALAAFGATAGAAPQRGGGGFEQNVSANGDWHAGEPEIAINPRDPNNLVMVWPEELATGIYRNPVTGTFDSVTGLNGSSNDPHSSRCGLAVSHDAGVTWHRSVLPAQTAQSTLCSDTFVAAGPDGTFYAGSITYHQPMQQSDGSADVVISSADGGKTWSAPPVDAIGNRGSDFARYEAGSNPETGCTCDRPWLNVDQTTGTVYLEGQADSVNGSNKTESWITASHDHGRTFGTVYPVDSPALPQYGVSSSRVVNGVLAVLYIGTRPSDSAHVLVFETSRDGGRTFSRHIVDVYTQTGVQGGNLVAGVNLAADPSHPGRYVVMVAGTGMTGDLIYRTSDGGATWSVPVTVQVGTYHPWVEESPHGVVAVMGRELYTDGSQDVLAAFSLDGGAHFTTPVFVNHSPAPAPPPSTNTVVSLYDDVSWVTLTDRYAWFAWGDWRVSPGNPNGETNAWMARLPVPGSGAVAGSGVAAPPEAASSGPSGSAPSSGLRGGSLPATGRGQQLTEAGVLMLLVGVGIAGLRRFSGRR